MRCSPQVAHFNGRLAAILLAAPARRIARDVISLSIPVSAEDVPGEFPTKGEDLFYS